MNKSKLITLILTLALVVASIFAVSVVASADDAVVPTIKSKNLYFETNTQIAVQVSASGTLPAGAQLGIMVYDSENVATIADFNPETAKLVHTSYKTEDLDGKDFYLTQSIPANDMSYPYIIVPVIKNGDNVTYGAAQFYSVVNYAYDKLNELNTSVELAKVCDNIIKYAAAAEGALGANGGVYKFGYAEAVNGTVGNHGYAYAGVNGDTVVLRADAIKDGKYFVNWTNAAGEVVSAERVTAVKITSTSGAEVYTANYGEATDFAYAQMLDMSSLADGKLTSTTAPSWLVDAKFTDANYTLNIRSLANGNKALVVDKTKAGAGNGFFCLVPDAVANEASYDVTIEDFRGNNQFIYPKVKLPDGTEIILRTNITYQSNGTIYMYANGANGASKVYAKIDGQITYLKVVDGQTLNIRTVCDDENFELDFYVNGSYFGSISMLGYYKCNIEESGNRNTTTSRALAKYFGIAVCADGYTPVKNNGEYLYKNGTFSFTETKTVTATTADSASSTGYYKTITTTTTVYNYVDGVCTKGEPVVEGGEKTEVTASKASTSIVYKAEVISVENAGTPAATNGDLSIVYYGFGWTNDFLGEAVVETIVFN